MSPALVSLYNVNPRLLGALVPTIRLDTGRDYCPNADLVAVCGVVERQMVEAAIRYSLETTLGILGFWGVLLVLY